MLFADETIAVGETQKMGDNAKDSNRENSKHLDQRLQRHQRGSILHCFVRYIFHYLGNEIVFCLEDDGNFYACQDSSNFCKILLCNLADSLLGLTSLDSS